MIRVVDFPKAIAAGAAGAVAMEVVLRGFALGGVPLFDLVHQLALVVPGHGELTGWAAGLVAHIFIGIVWAIFYAYFFWARLKWPPLLQGLAFAALPALLTLVLVYPQLQLMQLDRDLVRTTPQLLFGQISARDILGVVLSHAIYGLVLGAIYSHPVGYPVGKPPEFPKRVRVAKGNRARRRNDCGFIFATGVECSYPTIEHGKWRRDEMQSTGHYDHWQEDFDLANEIGITHIRYGPPLHLIFQGPGKYDWSLVDEPMRCLEQYGPEPIVDLCHFGVPAWLANFQNDEVPKALAEYAGAFAERYPWVRFYTPVNEMYVCARISALEGEWNEQCTSEQTFVNAVLNLAGASIGMTDAILKTRPDAIFINSESSEFAQPCCPDERIQEIAEFENERRFLALDLIYAHKVSDRMRAYLAQHGVTDEVLSHYAHREVPRRSVLGLDYYEWNEHLVGRDGCSRSLGELFGWYTIASQYWHRYQMTLMHTETNRMDASDASRWLWRQWHNVQLMRKSGVPMVGFTWYSLTDQIDWDIGLTKALGVIFPVGLFDLNRDPREVGLSYKQLIDMYCDHPDYRECKALKELMQ